MSIKTSKRTKRKQVAKKSPESEALDLRKARLSAVLSSRFPPERVADEIERLLKATVRKFNHVGVMVDESPDFAAVAKGIHYVLAYTEGLPVKREERVSLDVKGSKDLMLYAERSQSFRLALGKIQNKLAMPIAEAEVIEGDQKST